MFARIRRSAPPADGTADFYWGLIKEADSNAAAAIDAHYRAAAEAELLDARVAELERELDDTRGALSESGTQLSELSAAHQRLQHEVTAVRERVLELEAAGRTLTDERDAALATEQVVRSEAARQLAAVRAERDRLHRELETTLRVITRSADRHRSELATECHRSLERAAGIRMGADVQPGADLEGHAAAPAPSLSESG